MSEEGGTRCNDDVKIDCLGDDILRFVTQVRLIHYQTELQAGCRCKIM
jgi:hypothetical protein